MNIELEKKMDKALHYVAKNLSLSGHNSKPVLSHSFRVGLTLYSNNYEEDTIIAGILHDLIEDTDITKEDIEKEYNSKIASLVDAVSFNPHIEDKYLQAKEMFENCLKYGYDALIIKCADLLDNINYVPYADLNMQKILIKKYQLFLDMSKDLLKDEKIYHSLEQKVIAVVKNM